LPDAQKSRRKSQIIYGAVVALAHWLVPWMESIPSSSGRTEKILTNCTTNDKEANVSESSSVPPMLNKAMKFILRSPLHGVISKYLMLITFTGR
jgi:hypothetical protein